MPKINANHVELYYEVHGPENAPVLVLNNGILMTTASWPFQTGVLAQRYRVLLYDCRGQGQSDHPDSPYSMELHADDLAALLERLDVEQAHIAGISYGGELAQVFAHKYPGRTRSLILADTVSEIGPELQSTVQNWIAAARSQDGNTFFDATVSWNFSPQFMRENPRVLEDARPRYGKLDFPAVIRLCQCFLEFYFTQHLAEIKAPTCILVGENDMLKGRRYAEILRRGIPGAELHVLREAGHASCWERAAEFNTVVLGFLAKQG